MKTLTKMMAIKSCSGLIIIFILFLGCEKIERDIYNNKDGRFVRFNLMVDSDGQPVDNNKLNPGATVVSEFTKKTISSLAVPVSLTSEPLDEIITVNFSVEITGNYTGAVLNRANMVSFTASGLTDTINIDFMNRWDPSQENKIKLKLTGVSDPEIHIGFPNNYEKYDELTIILSDLNLSYSLDKTRTEIIGFKGEQIPVDIFFPQGYFESDIQDTELISVQESVLNSALKNFR